MARAMRVALLVEKLPLDLRGFVGRYSTQIYSMINHFTNRRSSSGYLDDRHTLNRKGVAPYWVSRLPMRRRTQLAVSCTRQHEDLAVFVIEIGDSWWKDPASPA